MTTISAFRGEHGFLSNFYAARVVFAGMIYSTAEHAFQAAKSNDWNVRRHVQQQETPGDAKRVGRRVRLRGDWEAVKVKVMLEVLVAKFEDPELRRRLLLTGTAQLVEGNNWGDTVWGVCNGAGKNYLGKLLMRVRGALRIASTTGCRAVNNEQLFNAWLRLERDVSATFHTLRGIVQNPGVVSDDDVVTWRIEACRARAVFPAELTSLVEETRRYLKCCRVIDEPEAVAADDTGSALGHHPDCQLVQPTLPLEALTADIEPLSNWTDTSMAAADSVRVAAPILRARVYACIRHAAASGSTCCELEHTLDLRHQTASARCTELRELGFIVDSGARRNTDSGRQAIVWTAVALENVPSRWECVSGCPVRMLRDNRRMGESR